MVVHLQPAPQYHSFRTAPEAGLTQPLSYTICTVSVPHLALPQSQPLFITETNIRIYVENGIEYRYVCDFFTGEVKALLIDDGKEKVLQIAERDAKHPLTELELLNALGLEKTMSEHGRFILHASFIATDKGAILFTAPSQTGKSTQASLWENYRGAEIINGDRAGIWKSDDGIWMAGGVPWCGTSGIMKNNMMPLRAIVILEQGAENEVRQLSLPAKLGRLLEQTTINPWNKEMLVRAKLFWMDLLQETQVMLLSCRPDEGAVEALERELETFEREKEQYGHGE